MDEGASRYGRWTRDALIKRIQVLEHELGAKDRLSAPVGASTETIASDGGNEIEAAATAAAAEAETEPQGKKNKKQKKKDGRGIDPSKYATRHIALKLAYLGKNYGGFEYQQSTNVPTIEEELWKAMVKGCLIFPENPDEINWHPWEYAKCGRTDRGVSAFGQVISIRVRSNRPLPKEWEGKSSQGAASDDDDDEATAETTTTTTQGVDGIEASKAIIIGRSPKREFNDITDELPYPRLLNRLLPPDIRILAWCPTIPADFSARHHCRERQYRYFFTQPAYSPIPEDLEDPGSRSTSSSSSSDKKKPKSGWLDIEAMRAAAKKFEGLHDFRNFCQLDPTKTQQSFRRRIFESDVVEAPDAKTALPHLQRREFQPSFVSEAPSEPGTTASPPAAPPETFPKVYYFHVRGSAFLWHQIRCMVSVLFMVGQGLEDVSVVDRLLDVASEPRRPAYNFANETPLVLWDCLFPRDLDDPTRTDGMEWVYVGHGDPLSAHGTSGVVNHAWKHWREHKMDELLAGQLLNVVATQTDLALRRTTTTPTAAFLRHANTAQKMFEGGNGERSHGKYVPLLKRQRLASPQEAYDKDARRKGFENAAHMQEVIAQRKAEAAAGGVVVVTQTAESGSDEMVE
ncbi:hypothetical protein FHL15_009838 [Xylaria flabelliformis]|uniref:Pseudouridine synthase I TruA alpha/beta domain-containing protein n=1 Tax=Xylaria flabelliformis TaxID=2512241 RepID=A0A553HMS7_9PEZI|nr:hypothetical protein FHL15_009838 [Xylaria flabelliformis]